MKILSVEVLDPSIYSKLKNFKTECIMLDWNFDIRVIDNPDKIYVDIDKCDEEGYMISRFGDGFRFRHLFFDNDDKLIDQKQMIVGSLDECIDYFRQTVLMGEN